MTFTENAQYCIYHPQTETSLRCNRCDNPICIKCAVRTPTGYRCKDCIRGLQKTFETSNWYDYPLAFVLAAILAYLGSRIVPYLGFFTFLISPIVGVIIAETIRFAVRKRRSKLLNRISLIATILGSLPTILLYGFALLLALGQGRSFSLGIISPLIWQLVYVFTITTSVYYRLGGIRI